MPAQSSFLRHMTWEEAKSAFSHSSTVVVLPIGSIEQHGPHLPLEVDTAIVENLATKVVSYLDRSVRILVAPTVCFGCSEHHLAFPGTISLRHETFMCLIEDIISSLHKAGARRFFLLNAHGGNYAALSCVVQKLQVRLDSLIALGSWWNMAKERLSRERSSAPGGAGHAGELETSLMQYLAADLVKEEKFRAHYPTAPELFFPRDMLRKSERYGAVVYLETDRLSSTGQLGDPTEANPQKGAKFCQIIVEELAKFLQKFSSCSIPARKTQ